jgi:hypothetical protein
MQSVGLLVTTNDVATLGNIKGRRIEETRDSLMVVWL